MCHHQSIYGKQTGYKIIRLNGVCTGQCSAYTLNSAYTSPSDRSKHVDLDSPVNKR